MSVVRILVFLLFLLGISIGLSQLVDDRQIAIILFAFVVVILSPIMPFIGQKLNGRLVDAIYYVAAISGVVLLFVSEEPAQNVVELQRSLARLNMDITDERTRNEILIAKIEDFESEAVKNEDRIRDIEQWLGKEAQQTLIREETDRSRRLTDALSLEGIAKYVEKEKALCDAQEDLLIRAKVSIEFERQQSISGGNNGIANSLSISDQLQLDGINRQLHRCWMLINPSENRISSSESGYDRLLGIFDVAVGILLNETWGSLAVVLPEPSPKQVQEIEKVRELQQARYELAWAQSRTKELVQLSQDAAKSKIGVVDEINLIARSISDTEEALFDAKTQSLTGIALLTKEWLTFTWPYFLISILGLKLARTRLWDP